MLLQVIEERLKEFEGKCRDLYDTNKRLEEHVADLESRKRPPLYQKKQEEELKAAVEKAQEAEVRAQDAEIKAKEAKVSFSLLFC
jgi:centromeric protein E